MANFMQMRWTTGFLVSILAVGAVDAAYADDHSRISLLEENDSLYFKTDKHYTQGLRLSYLSPSSAPGGYWDWAFDALAGISFLAPTHTDRRHSFFLGQSIFTPDNLAERPPDAHDRPYAGWLYGGMSLLQTSGSGMLEDWEIEAGVVGPGAAGKLVQNDWHQFIGIKQARGWSNQVQNEPGGVLSYDRLWRVRLTSAGGLGVDVVPEIGATVGNVFDYGEAGGMIRFGNGLEADYGPARVRPSLSGTDYFDSAGIGDGVSGYFYLGAQGRIVARNLFLDGNSFRASPSVQHKTLVADVQAGVALMWSRRVRFDFSVVRRTEEFVGQRAPDVIGTAALSFSL
jgi:lipid A 3-O-deacylase